MSVTRFKTNRRTRTEEAVPVLASDTIERDDIASDGHGGHERGGGRGGGGEAAAARALRRELVDDGLIDRLVATADERGVQLTGQGGFLV